MSLPLNNSKPFAVFISSGNTPCDNDILHIWLIGSLTVPITLLTRFIEIVSLPIYNLLLRFETMFSIFSFVGSRKIEFALLLP